jgi:hypothetical protein
VTFLLYFGHYLPEKGRFPFCAAKQLKNGMQRKKRTKNEHRQCHANMVKSNA